MNLPYDLGPIGRTVSVLLLVYCAAEVLLIVDSYLLLGFYTLVESGNATNAELDAAVVATDTRGLWVAVVFGVCLLATYIASAIWIYRAASNAGAAMPDDARITPGWTVGWFFVPIANLWMSYRGIKQTWNGLHGNADLMSPMPGWTFVWWACWLLSNTLASAGTRTYFGAETIDQYRTASTLDILSSVIAIAAALMFRNLVLILTRASAGAEPHRTDTIHQEGLR